MLSFQRLGNSGRLGNQLFQYAFLRTQAEKLGVQFYCPHWLGDEIFTLHDEEQRAKDSKNIVHIYRELVHKRHYPEAVALCDNTEVVGYFESEKNFDRRKARFWYSFREESVAHVRKKYTHIDFTRAVGMHLRLGDKREHKNYKNKHYIPRIKYYKESLKLISDYAFLLVFSDDSTGARQYFKDSCSSQIIYIEDNTDWEDLYLMSQCRDFICGASTFSWWGAWLQERSDKIVVFPEEGLYRPGSGFYKDNLIPPTWKTVPALYPIRDHYSVTAFPFYHYLCIVLIGRQLKRYFPRFFAFLELYLG